MTIDPNSLPEVARGELTIFYLILLAALGGHGGVGAALVTGSILNAGRR